MDKIEVRGARTHNLKNINLTIPRDKLIVITGLSGSGKSSLAFDTLYAEGQRRYVESLSAYARQFLSLMEKPDVDHIEGLSPAISIEQKSTSHNPRSTVGTITEVYDYLRLLYARVGEPRCPEHQVPLKAQTISQMVDKVLELPEGSKNYGRAEPQLKEIAQLAKEKLVPLCEQYVVVTQGFIGSDAQGNTTTLGRGGSDYSAALIAEAVQASGLEIWTDVPGIYSTDPRIAPKAAPIPEISFSEASEMANFGAKILHPSTLLPAVRHGIPVFVGSSKEPEKGGTWIRKQVESAPLYRALALRCNQTMVTLRSAQMFHAYGFLAKVFEILAKHKISVDLITTSEISVSLTLDKTDTSGGAPELPEAVRAELEELCTVEVEYNLCLIALIGNKMKESRGYAKQVFSVLEDYNLRMICYGASAHNLCFLLHESVSKQAVQKLHKELFEQE